MCGENVECSCTRCVVVFIAVMCCFSIYGSANECHSQAQETLDACFSDIELVTEFDINSEKSIEVFADENTKPFCNNTAKATEAFHCAVKWMERCLEVRNSDYRMMVDYLPDKARLAKTLHILCEDPDLVTDEDASNCMEAQSPYVESCLEVRLPYELDSSSQETIVCSVVRTYTACTFTHLSFCGCPTTKVMTDIMRGPLYPEKCGSFYARGVPRFSCNPHNSTVFIFDGTTTLTSSWTLMSWSVLVAAGVCWFNSFH